MRDTSGRTGVRRPTRLSLPGFTFGLDIVLLIGRLHLGKHQTVDEVHEELLERLAALGVTISRREILYLFEAYCTLLRASSEVKEDQEWLAQVKKNGGGGIIAVMLPFELPGMARAGKEEWRHHRVGRRHPAGTCGNETIYLVRDALTCTTSRFLERMP